MTHPDPSIIPWVFSLLAVGWFVFAAVMLWRSRQQDRCWRHETRVHQRVSQLLEQEYVNRLTPEARERRAAQRRHLEELRARAEAELAAEDSRRRRT
jgi:hypothetical protein